jgi:rfaE bifunctional protein nucleotidyltransferase chain/domain
VLTKSKILPLSEASSVLDAYRKAGKVIVQCHGIFDIVHPGHVVFLEEASERGDIMVVSVTDQRHVNKGPGRPYFNDQLRVRSLAAMACVDYVVLVQSANPLEAIRAVRPHVYCKGRDYATATGPDAESLKAEKEAVEAGGGRLEFIGSVSFSATRLLNRHFDTHSAEVRSFCSQLALSYSRDSFLEVLEEMASLRVLVVGDIIFDRYTTVAVQGLTSKNRILSGRFLGEETQAGGALAVFRHVREFTPHVRLLSIVGSEPWAGPLLSEFLEPERDAVVRLPGFTTIVKQRFVEPLIEGKELSKLFSVNLIDGEPPSRRVLEPVLRRLESEVEKHDLVIAMDFGHGLFEESLRDLVQDKADFLAINVQTNSNNHGFNVINRQFRRADAFSLDAAEMTLACGRRRFDFEEELRQLKTSLKSKYAWLTRGSVETIGLGPKKDASKAPPFESQVVDAVGAGDAFCSMAFLAAAAEVPIDLATFLGQLAGAQAVRIIGNRDPIRKAKLLEGGLAMLNW